MILDKDLILQFEESDCNFGTYDPNLEPKTLTLGHANKLLRDEMSRWPVVYQSAYASDSEWSTVPSLGGTSGREDLSKLKSRIVPPQPIRTETAEDVLRDIIKEDEYMDTLPIQLIERARKVLK